MVRIITRKHLALELHDLLQLPFDSHAKPIKGRRIVRAITDSIMAALRNGENVRIHGFGTFKVVTQSPRRTGNNIVYGRRKAAVFSPVAMNHPAKRKVVFVPSDTLLAMLNMDTPNSHEQQMIRNWKCA